MAEGSAPQGNYIGGEWVDAGSGEKYESRSPSDPELLIGEFPSATAEDAAAAAQAAADALAGWSGTPAQARGALLAQVAARIEDGAAAFAETMSNETGKPITEARMEVGRSAAILRFYASEALRNTGEAFEHANGSAIRTMRRPRGAVALITPWNFPAAIPVWKLAPALAYGNTVVVKLANDSPATGLELARCFDEAECPPGVLNMITGRGSVCGPALIGHEGIAAVSFTGSAEVGDGIRVSATELSKPCQLEMGGHSPVIVLDDADLGAAVEGVFRGAFWSAGQKCTATRRIYVQDGIHDAFRAGLIERIANAAVGPATEDSTEVGPVVNEDQMQMILDAIQRGRDEGGSVAAGGGRVDAPGYLIEPTLFEDVADDAFLSQEEVFGPVTTMYRVADLDEALKRANSNRYGLSASLYTNDMSAADRFANEMDAGILHYNGPTAGAEVHVPFGGLKASGWGPHEQGRAAIEFYTEQITLYQGA